MGSCCTKREEKGKDITGKPQALESKKDPIQFSSMDLVKDFCVKHIEKNINNEILVLNINQSDLQTFMKDLPSLLNMMRQFTKKTFLPICISNSPIDPIEKLQIILRTSDNVMNISLDGWFTNNINDLCKKFVIQPLQSLPEDMEQRKNDLVNHFQAQQQKQLMLIGGFQDKNNVTQCLYVKLDRPQANQGQIIIIPYDSTGVEREEFRKKVEELVNHAHIEENAILRCVLTSGTKQSKTHYFVFEVEDKLQYYLILHFPSDLQDKLNKMIAKDKSALSKNNQMQVEFDDTLTKWINAQERKHGNKNTLVNVVINNDFSDSLAITSP